jgi:hypothetical protein
MPRKPETAAAPTVIKWTEEEWERIASRLLEMKGRQLLKSPQLEEVKAKDVFNAQEVLSDARHRKLISISQGFQAIRQRLHSILQKLDALSQNDLFDAPKAADKEGQDDAAPAVAETAAASAGQPELPESSAVPEQTEPEGEQVQQGAERLHQNAAAEAKYEEAGDEEPVAENASDEQTFRPAAATPRQHPQVNERAHAPRSQQAADSNRGRHSAPQPSQAAAGNFVEMARPFVAMVCEELAAALVNNLMERGGPQAFSSLFQAVLAGAGQTPPADQRSKRGHQVNQPLTKQAAYAAASGMEQAPHAAASADDDDAHLAEMDVQPLFDPKLPPSPNSTFKPMIALIGISTRDFEDLQPRFPQLELAAVSLDDLRTAPSLRNCQRMIGLREDIPAAADEFLRKTFRNRYLRVTGGIAQISEQLSAWLDNPGSMNAGPNWPRKQGGKSQTNGYPKKRQFRRPRPNQ